MAFLWGQRLKIFQIYEKQTLIGSFAQMNPPLRSRENNDILWQALLNGVIDSIATDRAPLILEEKAQPYPKSPSPNARSRDIFALKVNSG